MVETDAIKYATLHLEGYIGDFQRLSVMVPNISERRLVVLFIEGLSEPLRGWIKAFDPSTLQEAMRKARSMELAAPQSKFSSKASSSYKDGKSFSKKNEKSDFKGKSAAPLNKDTIDDLREKLCFYCKGPYDETTTVL